MGALIGIADVSLREKCPNTEFFLVRIFLYSVQIQENTDQKKLRIHIWTLFTQCISYLSIVSLNNILEIMMKLIFRRIWLHLPEKSLMENFIFRAVVLQRKLLAIVKQKIYILLPSRGVFQVMVVMNWPQNTVSYVVNRSLEKLLKLVDEFLQRSH